MKIFKFIVSKIFLRKAILGIGVMLLLCMENQKGSNFLGGVTMTKIIDLSVKEKIYKSKKAQISILNHKVIFDYLFKSSYMPV